MKAIRFVGVTATAAMLSAGGVQSAAQSGGNALPAGLHPVMTIGMQVGFSGTPSPVGELWLAPDSSWSARLVSSGSEPCASRALIAVGDVGASSESDAAVVWTLHPRLVSVKDDTATVALRWSRDVQRAGLSPSDPIAIEREYTLTDGRNGVLDLVTASPDSAGCPSVAVTIGLRFSPMQQRDAAIAYDIWLVQDDGDGRVKTDRFQSVSRDGQVMDYFFKPLEYDATGSPVVTAASSGLRLNTAGRLRGTVVDGGIDVLVDGTVSYAEEASATSTHGRKRLLVRDGETVEFEMPAAPVRDLPHAGSLAGLFRRSRTSIRVTPRILWQTSPAH
jgi:hypothetical protein